MNRISRRSFLTATAALGLGSIVATLPASAASAETEKENCLPVFGIKNTQATYGVIQETAKGKLLGRNENGINIFLGIPYATAERWKMPVQLEVWEGLLNANYVGPVCPQTGGSGEYLSNPAYYLIDTSEKNFLNLNVWTPSLDRNAQKPVIVWLHGGGYSNGSSRELLEYDGKNLAQFGDVVFVSVNHRINYLGYLDLSAYGEEYRNSGNIGHADLVMALEWVRDNIASFGGDPGNVTIVGQSGGSRKVAELMAMPSAKGLFHKAVAMSSFLVDFPHTHADGQQEAAKLVKYLGLEGKSNQSIMETLTAMPYEQLAAACKAAEVEVFYGINDGEYVMPDISYSAEIPLLFGSVMAEHNGNLTKAGITGSYRNNSILRKEDDYYSNIRTFLTDEDIRARYQERYGDKAQAVMDAFQKAYPGHDLYEGLYFDNVYRAPSSGRSVNDNAVQFTQWGGTVYQYIGAYTLPLFGGTPAWHTGGDLAFAFRNLDSIQSWIAGDEAGADAYSRAMATALVNFAKTGDPSQKGLAWHPFTVEKGETMVFDKKSKERSYPDREFLELIRG